MARKNKRWETHQSLGLVVADRGVDHTCDPIPTRGGHVCLACGRSVRNPFEPQVIEARPARPAFHP